jgi:hypothetical protein
LSACLKSPRRNHSTATGRFRIGNRPLSRGGRNRSICPTPAVRGASRDRLSWVDCVEKLLEYRGIVG